MDLHGLHVDEAINKSEDTIMMLAKMPGGQLAFHCQCFWASNLCNWCHNLLWMLVHVPCMLLSAHACQIGCAL